MDKKVLNQQQAFLSERYFSRFCSFHLKYHQLFVPFAENHNNWVDYGIFLNRELSWFGSSLYLNNIESKTDRSCLKKGLTSQQWCGVATTKQSLNGISLLCPTFFVDLFIVLWCFLVLNLIQSVVSGDFLSYL